MADTPAPKTTPPDLEFEEDLPEPPPDLETPHLETPAEPSDPEPSRFCARHPGGTLDACRGCGDARHALSQWTARHAAEIAQARYDETRAAAHARGLAVAACSMCDENGYIGRQVCDHDPGTADRARRGLELARKAIADAATSRRDSEWPKPGDDGA